MVLQVPPCRVWCGAFVHQAFRQAGVRLSGASSTRTAPTSTRSPVGAA